MISQKRQQSLGFGLLRLCTLLVLVVLGFVIGHLVANGWPALSREFLTAAPREGMTEGGVFPALVGTALVTVLCAVFSVPLGVGAGIYLAEYAPSTSLTVLIRTALQTLAGVPSIVFGLFGVALFVQTLGLGTSLISSGLTLGLLTLPTTVTATEEAIKMVPQHYREAGLALGASHWEVVRDLVLPQALPGILTGVILTISRAAGEVAPILFTGVAFYLPALPDSLSSQFMALPYHLYILATQHQDINQVRPLAYGTALILIALVLALNLGAITLRQHFRNKLKKLIP